jgi:hypothetical protein
MHLLADYCQQWQQQCETVIAFPSSTPIVSAAWRPLLVILRHLQIHHQNVIPTATSRTRYILRPLIIGVLTPLVPLAIYTDLLRVVVHHSHGSGVIWRWSLKFAKLSLLMWLAPFALTYGSVTCLYALNMTVPPDTDTVLTSYYSVLRNLKTHQDGSIPIEVVDNAITFLLKVQLELIERNDLFWKTLQMGTFRNDRSFTLAVVFDLILWLTGLQESKIAPSRCLR